MSKQTIIKELEWLKANGAYLSIRKIEQELNLPATTLYRFVKGERGLDGQWHDAVIKWVRNFKN
jgi:predicted transcriptional regulator